MKTQFFDIVAAKDYETNNNGTIEKKTAWYKVGTAWKAKSTDALNLELYLFPGQRYVLNMKPKDTPEDKQKEQVGDFAAFEDVTH